MSDDVEISFYPKRLSSDYMLVEETGHAKSVWVCFRKNTIFSPDMLSNTIMDILKYCLTHRVDSYRIHLDRKKGIKLIKRLAQRSNYSDLTLSQIIGLFWSSLSVVHHFHIRILPDSSMKAWYRKRQYKEAIYSYEKVLLMLLPHLFATVIQALITFFTESKLWNMETLIATLIKKILDVTKDNTNVVNNLLDIVDATENLNEARNVLRVLCNLLNYIEWVDMDEDLITRMLELYRQTTVIEERDALKSGYEVCLRYAFKHMKRKDVLKCIRIMLEWTLSLGESESTIVEFGNLLEYAATLHNSTDDYSVSITDQIFPFVLELVASENIFLSLLGCRVLYFLMDRQDNRVLLMTPRIFFQDVSSNLKIGNFMSEDKRFLQNYHKGIHVNLMAAVINHGYMKVNLECAFACIALLAVEVPCGYTAAASVCLTMAIQEYTIANYEHERAYHIHACCMFTMTLVCYVHNATVFYDYVNAVLSRRAQFAPHLNPPLCTAYPNVNHSVHLQKPDLFFEDWEARYGLWKCFITQMVGGAASASQISASYSANYSANYSTT